MSCPHLSQGNRQPCTATSFCLKDTVTSISVKACSSILRSLAKPGSCPLALFPRQHEFHHLLQLLHQLLVPGLRPAAQLVNSMARVYASARGSSFQISMSCSTSFWDGLGSQGLATGMAGGLAGIGGIQNEKETMQSLKDRLASYLDRLRSLEIENWRLESKIWEHLEKKGPQVRDWGHYFKIIEDLRARILANTVDNACIVLQIDNAHLAADDFRVKYETDSHVPVCGEQHYGLCKVTDDTNVTWLQLETEIEALKEELLFMKNQEDELKDLRAQIASSGLTMEVDAPKSQDLAKIMADIWAQYDELARKNREELDKCWSQRNEESTTVVTTQSAEVGAAEMTLTEAGTYSPVLGDRPGLHEKSEGQLGEQPKGGGGPLHPADGAAQRDPAAPGVGAGPDPGRGATPGPGVPC
ncbi:LOW QUALITY PROTEIN: keratin, type I cytoskeletal 18-like [Pongo pygmaeus]|uniref:LOW QUALITY PROTEIN: keratin, type I cytoskeletal 18-like n=1 Tax=Pongo pygmaeus TaxID=9600 RepID=UPI0023E256E6|nr:LOW QUALITY PROTEIN: keratin, type I cytoskeletal 18-like [Pongo pygmaeus]